LKAREECIEMLKFHLSRALQRMKAQADRHRTDKQLSVGTWVYVKLQPYRQQSVALRRNQKLSPKFFGPFPIIARVGPVAYKLNLPVGAKLHPVFHVSLLKEHLGPALTELGKVPDLDDHGLLTTEPVAIVDRKLGRKGNRAVVYLLVQWANKPREEAIWELYSDMEAKYPSFNLEA